MVMQVTNASWGILQHQNRHASEQDIVNRSIRYVSVKQSTGSMYPNFGYRPKLQEATDKYKCPIAY